MGFWKCNKCDKEFSDSSHKEFGGVNDSYILIYECMDCHTVGSTVTKNTTSISGAKVLKTLDLEIHSKEEVQEVLQSFNLK